MRYIYYSFLVLFAFVAIVTSVAGAWSPQQILAYLGW